MAKKNTSEIGIVNLQYSFYENVGAVTGKDVADLLGDLESIDDEIVDRVITRGNNLL